MSGVKKETKFLIIKLGAIGDVVMASSMLHAIKENYSNPHITWVCGKIVYPLLNLMGGIDEFIIIDEEHLLRGKFLSKAKELLKVWWSLLGRHFDFIIIGYSDSRYKILTLTCFGKRKTFNRNLSKRFFPVPGRYHGDEYCRLVLDTDGPNLKPAILPEVKISTPSNLKSLFVPKTSIVIALAPGGAKNILSDDFIRRWPIKNYVELAERLINDRCKVIITGSPSDEWVCKEFQNLDIINLVGKTSLIDILEIYAQCDLVITHDSGPMHLAILAGTNLIALFGPTNPYEKVPKSDKFKILWGGKDLPCRPCYDGKYYAKCDNNLCMQKISVDQVLKEIYKIFEKTL